MIATFSVFLLVYASDAFTKWLVRSRMPLGAEIRILPDFSLTHVQNTGIAFGLFQRENGLFLIVGAVLACAVVWVAVRAHNRDRFTSFVLAAVLGGAAGNLTDRIFRGHVTDFLDFYVGVHHWPAFNVADSAICVGAALLIWHSFRKTQAK